LIPKHLLQMKNTEQSLDSINGYADRSYSDRHSTVKPKMDFVRLLDGIESKFQTVTVCKEDFKPETAEKHRDLLIDSLLDDITYFSETRGLALKVEQGTGSLCLSHKGANNTITRVYFNVVYGEKIIFSYDDVCYSYTSGMFAELLTDYTPPENTFFSGLKRSLGLGNNTPGENSHD